MTASGVEGRRVLFASANGRTRLPSRFARRAMVAKPFSARHIVQALEALLA